MKHYLMRFFCLFFLNIISVVSLPMQQNTPQFATIFPDAALEFNAYNEHLIKLKPEEPKSLEEKLFLGMLIADDIYRVKGFRPYYIFTYNPNFFTRKSIYSRDVYSCLNLFKKTAKINGIGVSILKAFQNKALLYSLFKHSIILGFEMLNFYTFAKMTPEENPLKATALAIFGIANFFGLLYSVLKIKEICVSYKCINYSQEFNNYYKTIADNISLPPRSQNTSMEPQKLREHIELTCKNAELLFRQND